MARESEETEMKKGKEFGKIGKKVARWDWSVVSERERDPKGWREILVKDEAVLMKRYVLGCMGVFLQ